MVKDILPILISFGYITLVMIISLFINKSFNNKEFSRKFIHIMVGNWVFLYPMFTSLSGLMFTPLVFVLINYISDKHKLISSMERDNTESKGTIFYAISLSILSFLTYILDLPILLYSGMLVLAYGDGLAAVFGSKYKSKLLSRKNNKSLIGSLVVLAVSLIISLILFNNYYFINTYTLCISIIISILSMFLEMVGSKGYDNLNLPLGVASYIYLSIIVNEPFNFIMVNILLTVILLIAYYKSAIDLEGALLAFIIGLAIYVFGNIYILSSLLGFFIIGSAISKITNETKRRAEDRQDEVGSRSWIQVYSNSLPALILVVIYYYTNDNKFMYLAFITFASAYSDTFSSELGMLFDSKVINILDFKEVSTGVSGGVTLLGLLFGLIGASIASLFAIPYLGQSSLIIITLLGFSGTIIDSILGSSVQRTYVDEEGSLQDKVSDNLVKGFRFVDNSLVNFLSISLVALISYIIL